MKHVTSEAARSARLGVFVFRDVVVPLTGHVESAPSGSGYRSMDTTTKSAFWKMVKEAESWNPDARHRLADLLEKAAYALRPPPSPPSKFFLRPRRRFPLN